jgi:hypothetical protein
MSRRGYGLQDTAQQDARPGKVLDFKAAACRKGSAVAYSPSAHSEARKLVEDTLSKSLNIDLNNRDLRPENLIVF